MKNKKGKIAGLTIGLAIGMSVALTLPIVSEAPFCVKESRKRIQAAKIPESYEIDSTYAVVSTPEWDRKTEVTKSDGAYTFHAYKSRDGKSAWIHKIDINKKRGSTKTLAIPDKIHDLTVTTVGSVEYEDSDHCKNIFDVTIEDYHGIGGYTKKVKETTKLVLPDTLTTIKPYAFNGMYALKKVKIPDGVSVLENSIFAWCENLTEVTLPSGLSEVVNDFYSTWSTGSSFSRCFKLKKVKLSSKCEKYKVKNNLLLTKDGKTLVWASQGITNVKIPASVRSISDAAFGGTRATQITIGKNVKSIGANAFTSKKIKRINLSKKNKMFVKKGDAIYEKKNKKLAILIVNRKKHSIVVPKPVEIIMGDVSLCGSSIKKAVLPSSLKEVGMAWDSWIETRTSIYFKGTTPPQIVSDVPEEEYSCVPWFNTVYVKKSCKKKYIEWGKSRCERFDFFNLKTY